MGGFGVCRCVLQKRCADGALVKRERRADRHRVNCARWRLRATGSGNDRNPKRRDNRGVIGDKRRQIFVIVKGVLGTRVDADVAKARGKAAVELEAFTASRSTGAGRCRYDAEVEGLQDGTTATVPYAGPCFAMTFKCQPVGDAGAQSR